VLAILIKINFKGVADALVAKTENAEDSATSPLMDVVVLIPHAPNISAWRTYLIAPPTTLSPLLA
jgi:hypothetical protein